MTIKRITQLNALILLICIGIVFTVLIISNSMVQRTEVVVEKIANLEKETILLNNLTQNYVHNTSTDLQAQWQIKHDLISQLLNDSTFNGYQDNASFQELKKSNNTIQVLFTQIGQASKNEPLQERLENQILVHTQTFVGEASNLVRTLLEQNKNIQQRTSAIFFGAIIILLLVVLSILFYLMRTIASPIIKLTTTVKRIENGDTNLQAPSNLNNEIGTLGLTFNNMMSKLREKSQSLEHASKATESSLKYTQQLISAANAMIVGLDLNGHVTVFNETAEQITGYKKEEVMGKNWFELIVTRDRFPEVWKRFEEFQKQGKSIIGEFQNPILTKNGEERIIEWRNSDLHDNGRVIGTISFGIDVTERNEAEKSLQRTSRALRAISACNQVIIQSTNELEMIQKICDEIVKDTGYLLVWVGYAENNPEKNVKRIGVAGFEDGFLSNRITWEDNEYGQRPMSIAIRTGQIFRDQNIKSSQLSPDWKKEAIKRGYKSVVALPLNINETKAALTIYSKETDAFNDEEMKLLIELAKNLSYGINAIRAKEKEMQTEKILRESEKKFSAAFNGSTDLMAITRISDGKILEVNEGYSRMLGYTHNESINKTTTELSIWANLEDRNKFVAALQKDGRVIDFETVLRRKDGTTLTVLDSARTFKLQGEECILSTAHDITERKIFEEKIHANEEELKKAQQLGRIGNWSWNIATDTITWSEEYYHIMGFDPTQKPPKYEAHLKIYTPESAARLDAAVKKNTETGEPYELDLEIANPKSTTRWITARSETIYDKQGQIIGLRGTAQDITERKKTEQKLDSASKYNRVLIEASLDPLVTIGPDGKITDVNKATENITGYERDSLIGTNFSSYFTEPQKAENGYQKVFKEGYVRDYPLDLKNKNGQVTSVLYNASVYKDEKGEVLGVFAAARDITERKLAEERLRELDSIKSRFIRVVSHQLRTPLSAIRWQLESLLNTPEHLSELQKQMLHESYRADLEISTTINDLITALDIEEGRAAHLDKMPNSLISLWESIAMDYSAKCKTKEIVFETNNPKGTLPLIEMDSDKIRSVMEKLADNALIYTKEKGKITVAISQTDESLRFEITDTGVGIPEVEKAYVFNRFYRCSNASIMKPDAAGLGLYIAKNFIESHGGKIGFISTEGKGSTFWFEIPIHPTSTTN